MLLRRRRRGWLVATPVQRRPRRSWLKPIATRRISYRGRLGMAIVLRPARTFVRANSMLPRITRVLNRVTGTAPRRWTDPIVASVTVPGRHTERWTTVVATREASAGGTAVERVRTRLQIERLRIARHLRTETAAVAEPVPPPGPRGTAGPPGRSLTLVRAAAAPAPEATPAVSDVFAGPTELALAPRPSPLVEPATITPPDVEALATQVLDRIERRAIAQRERMGRI